MDISDDFGRLPMRKRTDSARYLCTVMRRENLLVLRWLDGVPGMESVLYKDEVIEGPRRFQR